MVHNTCLRGLRTRSGLLFLPLAFGGGGGGVLPERRGFPVVVCDLWGEVDKVLELNLLEASSATTSFFFGGTTFILPCDGRWRTKGLAELVTSFTLWEVKEVRKSQEGVGRDGGFLHTGTKQGIRITVVEIT